MSGNNEKCWRILKTALLIGALLVSVAVAYGTLRSQVGYNTEQLEKHTGKIESHEAAVVEMRTDIKYIKEAVDDIRENTKK